MSAGGRGRRRPARWRDPARRRSSPGAIRPSSTARCARCGRAWSARAPVAAAEVAMKTADSRMPSLALPRSRRRRLARSTKPSPEPVRPVVLAQVVAGSGGETAVFAGEVKPRYESDLAFRIGGKIVGAQRRRRRARDARGRCSRGSTRRTWACRRKRRRRRSPRRETEYDFAQGRVRALPEPARAEVRQRVGARREAQRDEREPREARAGEGASSP